VLDAIPIQPEPLTCPVVVDAVAGLVGVVDISVVMPAFNEQRRIGPSIEAVCAFLRQSGRTWELIVVDDGSSDLTAALADALIERDSRIKLIRSPRNSGKGHAVRVGVLASHGDEVLISDADLSTPILEVERLWAQRGGAVAAIGSRARPGSRIDVHQNPVRRLLGRLGNRYIRALAVPGVTDTQCGFKLLNGPVARALFSITRLNGWGIDVEILHLCSRFGWPVVEVPVRWSHSTGSKLRPTAYLHVLAEVAYLRVAHRRTQAPPVPQVPNGR
jgi:glycosyltransferase involved in cell wall biosynthesis